MKTIIDIPEYQGMGLTLEWDDYFTISTKIYFTDNHNHILLRANSEGLISLARHFLTLSQQNVPVGFHIHLDDLNSLEPGSCELIIEKI